jgi:hypothetical protein
VNDIYEAIFFASGLNLHTPDSSLKPYYFHEYSRFSLLQRPRIGDMPESQEEKKARREREEVLRDIAKEVVCCIVASPTVH